MTDDEAAYIEAKGSKASVVPELSIIQCLACFCGSNAGALRSAMPDADFLTAVGPLTTDMYLPSLPDIERQLHASAEQVQLTISAYLVGFAIAQVLYGPLADRHGESHSCSERLRSIARRA